jgi:hypothetical protein
VTGPVDDILGPMTPRDRPTVVLLVLAAAWSAALIVLALVLPGAHTLIVHAQADGQTFTTFTAGATLVQENGLKVLGPVGLPLVAVVVVAYALGRRRRRRIPGAGRATWGVVIVTGLASLVGILTVGPFLLPVVALLAVACGRAPERGVVMA